MVFRAKVLVEKDPMAGPKDGRWFNQAMGIECWDGKLASGINHPLLTASEWDFNPLACWFAVSRNIPIRELR